MANKRTSVQVKCAYCGEPKQVFKSSFEKSNSKLFFCHTGCRALYRDKNVKTKCCTCGKTVWVPPNRVGKKVFCSRDCFGFSCRQDKVKVSCANCGKELEKHPSRASYYDLHFCNSKCYGKWRSANLNGENSVLWSGGKVEIPCACCGKPLKVFPCHATHRNFCNKLCYSLWCSEKFSGPNNPNWVNGADQTKYVGFTKVLKYEIRQRDGFQCQVCGAGETYRNHDVHHIDYDKANNGKRNLITLCYQCHPKTNFNRDEWFRLFTAKMNRFYFTRMRHAA